MLQHKGDTEHYSALSEYHYHILDGIEKDWQPKQSRFHRFDAFEDFKLDAPILFPQAPRGQPIFIFTSDLKPLLSNFAKYEADFDAIIHSLNQRSTD